MAIQLGAERMGQIALLHAEDQAATHALQNGLRRPTEEEIETQAPALALRLNITFGEALAFLLHIHRY